MYMDFIYRLSKKFSYKFQIHPEIHNSHQSTSITQLVYLQQNSMSKEKFQTYKEYS